MRDSWTPAEDDRLRELRAAGLSAAMIARELPGRTRNAVIGRMNRLDAPPPPPKARGAWTSEAVEQLRALFAAGLPFAEIAARLGVSRGACIGKAERLGLRRGEAAKHPRGPRKRPGEPHPRPTTTREPQRASPPRQEEPMPAPNFIAMPARTRRWRPLVECGPGDCRYPADCTDLRQPATRFCCAPVVAGKSWCKEHMAVVWNRVPAAAGARRAA